MNITLDEILKELLPEFIDDWEKELDEKYDKLISEKNEKDMYRLAHTLKGSGYQFGLNELGDMGVELMEVCKKNDWKAVEEMGIQIKNSFADIKLYIQENPL